MRQSVWVLYAKDGFIKDTINRQKERHKIPRYQNVNFLHWQKQTLTLKILNTIWKPTGRVADLRTLVIDAEAIYHEKSFLTYILD